MRAALRKDLGLQERRTNRLRHHVDVAITPVYTCILEHNDWPGMDRTWHLGNRRAAEHLRAKAKQAAVTGS
jgi:hypothetical protein